MISQFKHEFKEGIFFIYLNKLLFTIKPADGAATLKMQVNLHYAMLH